jgi:hypothetical protein
MRSVGVASLFHLLIPALLAISFLVAGLFMLVRAESLPLEQPNGREDWLGQSMDPLEVVDEAGELPAPGTSLLVTQWPDQGTKGITRSRPLGITLLGLSLLCTCALGPVLIIGAVIGIVIRANRQVQMGDSGDMQRDHHSK